MKIYVDVFGNISVSHAITTKYRRVMFFSENYSMYRNLWHNPCLIYGLSDYNYEYVLDYFMPIKLR